jgi:hypothetical protein
MPQMSPDWRGDAEAIYAEAEQQIEGINIRYDFLGAIISAHGNINEIRAAVRDLLVRCKANGIDPLTLFPDTRP